MNSLEMRPWQLHNADAWRGARRACRGQPRQDNDFVSDISVYMNSGTGTSTGLLQRAILREADAWNKLVGLYGPLVYWWCRRWGLQPGDAENVGQEVFVRVFEGLPAFRGATGSGSFRGWILQIAHHCVVDHVRDQDPANQPTGGSDAQDVLHRIPAPETQEKQQLTEDQGLLLKQALALLQGEFSPRDVDAFSQLVLFGRKPVEVAAELKIKTGAVYAIKSRIIQRLKEEFRGLIDL
jgi:RNA polymerase sigma-70 factor, ECF subfamily